MKKPKIIIASLILFVMLSAYYFVADAVNQNEPLQYITIQNADYSILMDLINPLIYYTEVTGMTQINSEEITFGIFNAMQLPANEFIGEIDYWITEMYKNHNVDPDTQNFKQTIRWKKIEMKAEKTVSDQIQKLCEQKGILFTRYSEEEVNQQLEILKQTRQTQIEQSKQDVLNEKAELTETEKESLKQLQDIVDISYDGLDTLFQRLTQEPKGGRAMHSLKTGIPGVNDINPMRGDRQDRLKLKDRFNRYSREHLEEPYTGSGGKVYNWLPFWVRGEVKDLRKLHDKLPLRQASIRFKWNNEGLFNLLLDNNETIEAELEFYNAGNGIGIPGNGQAYIHKPIYWDTNLPSGYQDTAFMDNPDYKSFAMGTIHVSQIYPNKEYYVTIQGTPKVASTNVGLWKITFQRGYWYDHPWLPNTGDEWFVFNEECETTAKIKAYHKYNQKYWAPGIFESYTNSEKLFRYKEQYRTLSPNILEGIKIDEGECEAFNFKIEASQEGKYLFEVKKNLAYLKKFTVELYDQDYTLIGTLISGRDQLPKSLKPGDYYVVVKGR